MSDSKSPVANHKHCSVCGKPIALDAQFCSPECEETITKQRKGQRRTSWIFMGIIVVFLLVWFFLMNRP